jgi:hypothetical protein
MIHNRKFIPSSIGLIQGRIKQSSKVASSLSSTIETLMIESKLLDDAPFTWLNFDYLYGEEQSSKPTYGRIDKKDGELPLDVYVPMSHIQWCQNENQLDLLRDILYTYALEALLDVGKKYNLTVDLIAEERTKYDDIPTTLEELQAMKR